MKAAALNSRASAITPDSASRCFSKRSNLRPDDELLFHPSQPDAYHERTSAYRGRIPAWSYLRRTSFASLALSEEAQAPSVDFCDSFGYILRAFARVLHAP